MFDTEAMSSKFTVSCASNWPKAGLQVWSLRVFAETPRFGLRPLLTVSQTSFSEALPGALPPSRSPFKRVTIIAPWRLCPEFLSARSNIWLRACIALHFSPTWPIYIQSSLTLHPIVAHSTSNRRSLPLPLPPSPPHHFPLHYRLSLYSSSPSIHSLRPSVLRRLVFATRPFFAHRGFTYTPIHTTFT